MAFGQQSGPPASHKQLQYLDALVRKAGHDGFRDARGPLGLTQRQAGGKFTRDEAAAFIARLQEEAESSGESSGEPAAPRSPSPRVSAAEQMLRRMPAEQLAAELQRRGWAVVQP